MQSAWEIKCVKLWGLLETRKWMPQTHRTSIAHQKNGTNVLEPQQSESLTAKSTKNQDKQIRTFVLDMLPPWFAPGEHFTVTVNKNTHCKRHVDAGNDGIVSIMHLGNFRGGALMLDGDLRYEPRQKWVGFCAGKVIHWTEPLLESGGDKYAIILHNNMRPVQRYSSSKAAQG
jgi:hypothetical protein